MASYTKMFLLGTKKIGLPLNFARCDSNNVFWAQGMPQLWSLWQYKDCGYYGPVILKNGNLAGKLLEKWKNKTATS